ncbi:hypothetical protein [Sphingomonas sp.]|uniref:hypothetical protein n=1 Tax=Sphingomonas sp. TaxID=28214 RepID=UPI002B651536|nr:hypothetical protein [Sphingomonas sp.]HWK36692.1 hypothetical protein [Sphingomonas sp.]
MIEHVARPALFRTLAAATLWSVCVGAAPSPPQRAGATDAAEADAFAAMIAAERRFAADAARIGITPAFRAHAAPDGIMLRPAPMPAHTVLAAQRDDPELTLEWEPAIAAIARSNDLGVTSGPYRMRRGARTLYGQFLTVWRRDDDGQWRWLLDQGLPATARPALAFPARVARLRDGAGAAGQASEPDAGLAAADDRLNAAFQRRGGVAILPVMASDGYVLRPGQPATIRIRAGKLVDREPAVASSERFGLRVAAARDLAVTYGRLTRAGGTDPAPYVRIWRSEASGWRLLIDEVVWRPHR